MRAELPALEPAGFGSDDEVIVLSPANDLIYSRPAIAVAYCRFRKRHLGYIEDVGKHVLAAATEEVCSRGALHVHCLIWEASSTLLTYVSKYLHKGSGVSTKHLTCKL